MGALYGTTINARDPFFGPLTDDRAILTQAIELRLQMATGALWTCPEDGLPLLQSVNDGMTSDALARLPGRIQAEIERDERVSDVKVEVLLLKAAPGIEIRFRMMVTPNEDLPPFPLTFDFTPTTGELITRSVS